jgi:all-trans-retinol 13,14-reductase
MSNSENPLLLDQPGSLSRKTTRLIGTPCKQFHENGPFDAIVIGSGIGRLGTTALLAKAAGQGVLVLEKHYKPAASPTCS